MLEALIKAEQRSAALRAQLADSDAEVAVLRRKLRIEVGRAWANYPDSPDEGVVPPGAVNKKDEPDGAGSP